MSDVAMLFPRVFPAGPGGGNPAPTLLDADAVSDQAMQEIARAQGFETVFVLSPRESGNDFRLRFFVPGHEMSMCGHGTIGALWVLREAGRLPRTGQLRIETGSGLALARVPPAPGPIAVSQPWGAVTVLDSGGRSELARVLRVPAAAIGMAAHACTSRTKTIVQLASAAVLDALEPDWAAIGPLCNELDTTGLYPFATGRDPWLVHARQFPCNSGYREDAATGIAAAALACALARENKLPAPAGMLRVRQGEAMGRPSEIEIEIDTEARSIWICGSCVVEHAPPRV